MEPEIIRISEAFRIDEVGNTKNVRVVQFKIGTHGPFSVEIPEAEFTPERAREELEKTATTIRALLPKS